MVAILLGPQWLPGILITSVKEAFDIDINSLGPNDVIMVSWTLVNIGGRCLMAPSHNGNQLWLNMLMQSTEESFLFFWDVVNTLRPIDAYMSEKWVVIGSGNDLLPI